MLFYSLARATSAGAQLVLIRGSLDTGHICFTCDHKPDLSLEMLFLCFCDIDYMAKSYIQAQTVRHLSLVSKAILRSLQCVIVYVYLLSKSFFGIYMDIITCCVFHFLSDIRPDGFSPRLNSLRVTSVERYWGSCW